MINNQKLGIIGLAILLMVLIAMDSMPSLEAYSDLLIFIPIAVFVIGVIVALFYKKRRLIGVLVILVAFVLGIFMSPEFRDYASAEGEDIGRGLAERTNDIRATQACPKEPSNGGKKVHRDYGRARLSLERTKWTEWQRHPPEAKVSLQYDWTEFGMCIATLLPNGDVIVTPIVPGTTKEVVRGTAFAYAVPNVDRMDVIVHYTR